MHKICIKLRANFLNLQVNILCARIEVAFAGNDTNCLYWKSLEPDPGARTRNKKEHLEGAAESLIHDPWPSPALATGMNRSMIPLQGSHSY